MGFVDHFTGHSVVVSLWDVTEPLYIEILRSDGPQKRLADVDLTHLKSYWVIHTISIAALGHSKSLWAIYFVSSHPKSSWVIKTSYVRGPPIQNPIYCDSVVTTTTVWGGCNYRKSHFMDKSRPKNVNWRAGWRFLLNKVWFAFKLTRLNNIFSLSCLLSFGVCKVPSNSP